jgi:hypothetical protein
MHINDHEVSKNNALIAQSLIQSLALGNIQKRRRPLFGSN